MRSILFPLFLTAAASGLAHANLGEDTLAALQANYANTTQACNGAPAFVCSGILLRTTRPSAAYHTWHHSPNSREKGGVAFSYLRADAPVEALAEAASSGFILLPRRQAPQGSSAYRVLCAYPTDGDSWTRDAGGCGDNRQTEGVEQFCHEHGIDSAEGWVARYESTPGPEHQRYFAQCAFDVSRSRAAQAAPAFYQSLRAMSLMPERPFAWNEVIVGAWDEATSANLPIQAFFHVTGRGGLNNARFDQRDWHATTGKWLPVIEISLPDGERPASFSYRSEDQAVAPSL